MRKKTTNEFISNSIKIHNNKYDYTLVKYKNSKEKVDIICKKHGVFKQIPNSHLNGKGCLKCGQKLKNTNIFIKDAIKIHEQRYDYSLVEYVNSKTKVKIICKSHGLFEQLPNSHLSGTNCHKCIILNRTKSVQKFIDDSIMIHGHRYDYSHVIYINKNAKVDIICKEHGIFEQTPNSHLNGRNCPKCSEIIVMSRTKTLDDFIKDANLVHNNKYDYSKVFYINCKTKVDIICKKHGIFKQKPNTHLNNRGCPNCNTSKGENTIRQILEEHKINFSPQHTFANQPEHIKLCQYDFYLPKFNLVIEYHGEQHFIFVKFFHKTREGMLKRRERDKNKKQFCINNNINFVEIHYNQDINQEINNILQHIQNAGTSLEF